MILREYTARDSQNKNRVFVELQCDNCGEEYSRQKRWCSETHGCSSKCLSRLKGESVDVFCANCGIAHEKKRSSLAKSKSGLYFCSQACHNQGSRYIDAVMPSHYGTSQYRYRDKAIREFGATCNRCGFDDIRAIEVHHKDRNRENNDINNLEVLCANCHSIEHRA